MQWQKTEIGNFIDRLSTKIGSYFQHVRTLRLVIVGVLAGLSIAPLGLYFSRFHGALSSNHTSWGEFGSYVAGVYGTLAFIVLAYTTNISRKQFRIQNEDNVFFKLYDSLQQRISSSSITVGTTKYAGHQTLKALADKFHVELSKESIEIARQLLCEKPEKIADVHYAKIFEALYGMQYLESFDALRDRLIADINAHPDYNARWEKLKMYIGSRGEGSTKLLDALRATGSVNFYKIPFPERRLHYAAVIERVSDDHGEFLDGYFRNINFLLEFTSKAVNKKTYLSFLKAQLTKYELIILFYFAAGWNGELESIKNLNDLGIMDGLFSSHCQRLMIDNPSEEELRQEIDHLFSASR